MGVRGGTCGKIWREICIYPIKVKRGELFRGFNSRPWTNFNGNNWSDCTNYYEPYFFAGAAGAKTDRTAKSCGNDLLAGVKDISVEKLPVCGGGELPWHFGRDLSCSASDKSLCEKPGADKISLCPVGFGNTCGAYASFPLYAPWHMGGDENSPQGVCKAAGE